jgi:hypothetical protein
MRRRADERGNPPVNYSKWKDGAEFIGVAAIVASLIFVGLQMRQAQDLAHMELNAALVPTVVQLNSESNVHAGIWVRGSTGETLDPDEEFIFRNLVVNEAVRAIFEYRQRRSLGQDREAESPLKYFAILLHDNPGARHVWVQYVAHSRQQFDRMSDEVEGNSFVPHDKITAYLETLDE